MHIDSQIGCCLGQEEIVVEWVCVEYMYFACSAKEVDGRRATGEVHVYHSHKR